MTATLQLVRLNPTLGDESTVDLLDADGFKIVYGGWQQGIASGLTAAGNVTETIPLRVQGTNHNNLASKIDTLDDKLREAEWYFDNFTERYSVWLRAKMNDETNTRQALIRRGAGKLGASLLYPPADPGNMLRAYTLSLERYPWWEATSAGDLGSGVVSCGGGNISLGTVEGNIPARVGRLFIDRQNLSITLAEMWLGFRTDRFGTASNFQPVWQCEDGTAGTDTSIGASSATTAFVTTTMATRLTIELEDVTSDYIDQRGEFTVLLAAYVGDGTTTCHVRLKDGYSGTSNWRVQDRVRIHQQTTVKLYSLGTVKIPPTMHDRSTSAVFHRFALRIDAEQTAGAGNLIMDRLILIPFSEGALHIDGAATTNADNLYIETSADGIISGWQWAQAEPSMKITVEPLNYELPMGAVRVIFAGQTSTTFYPLGTAHVSIAQYYPRWRTLRGSA